jgi:hypothetical protein
VRTLTLLTGLLWPFRVTGKSSLTPLLRKVSLKISNGIKAIVTDSHFWVPFLVLLAGISLLVVLH